MAASPPSSMDAGLVSGAPATLNIVCEGRGHCAAVAFAHINFYVRKRR
jgi:hypothetical protein